MRSLRGHGAFTLIELLVVIAIIALLLSILIPSLQSARELSRRVTCQTHQKDIGTGIQLYIHDNNEITPPAGMQLFYQPGVDYWCWNWSDSLAKYYDTNAIPTTRTSQTWHQLSVGMQPANGEYVVIGYDGKPAMAYSKKMNCPSQKNTGQYHYAWNGGWYWTYGQPPQPQKEANMKNPSRYAQVVEPSISPSSCDSINGYGNWAIAALVQNAVHVGATYNVTYLDGHVEVFSRSFMALCLERLDNKSPNYHYPDFPFQVP